MRTIDNVRFLGHPEMEGVYIGETEDIVIINPKHLTRRTAKRVLERVLVEGEVYLAPKVSYTGHGSVPVVTLFGEKLGIRRLRRETIEAHRKLTEPHRPALTLVPEPDEEDRRQPGDII